MSAYRYALPLTLIGVVFLTGCLAHAGEIVYRDQRPHRTATYSPSPRQVDRDVQAYIQHLDRHLRLDRRQRTEMRRMLNDRTNHMMRNTRPTNRAQVYPFPREYDRVPNRTIRRFWINADRDLERMMTRRQRDDFRWLRDRASRDRRHDDRRDRRYDDYRYHNQAPTQIMPPRGATMSS